MRKVWLTMWALCCVCGAWAAEKNDALTQPAQCERCAKWNEPVAPFKVYGNTYYVGVRGMSSLLVATSGGLILLDGDLPQSASLIEANMRTLGFKVEDVRLILTSHAHFDHVGGVAALQRDSGAQVAASPSTAEALRLGQAVADDPQAGYIDGARFPPVTASVRVVQDGEVLKLGDTAVTAHWTPGHTPGSTSWSWKSCEGQRCLDVVYADSLTPVAAPGYRYTGGKDHPDVTARFRASIDKVAALPCDIIVTTHPEFGHLWDKLEARRRGVEPDPLVAPEGCRVLADSMSKGLDERIAEEKAGKAE